MRILVQKIKCMTISKTPVRCKFEIDGKVSQQETKHMYLGILYMYLRISWCCRGGKGTDNESNQTSRTFERLWWWRDQKWHTPQKLDLTQRKLNSVGQREKWEYKKASNVDNVNEWALCRKKEWNQYNEEEYSEFHATNHLWLTGLGTPP